MMNDRAVITYYTTYSIVVRYRITNASYHRLLQARRHSFDLRDSMALPEERQAWRRCIQVRPYLGAHLSALPYKKKVFFRGTSRARCTYATYSLCSHVKCQLLKVAAIPIKQASTTIKAGCLTAIRTGIAAVTKVAMAQQIKAIGIP